MPHALSGRLLPNPWDVHFTQGRITKEATWPILSVSPKTSVLSRARAAARRTSPSTASGCGFLKRLNMVRTGLQNRAEPGFSQGLAVTKYFGACLGQVQAAPATD